ncbi:unnamed protein product [Amoebophrya sp. A25]|nr:unnamed protein product [Amoebophrya sp. A25]|eukprot:GSA25T00005857001.1
MSVGDQEGARGAAQVLVRMLENAGTAQTAVELAQGSELSIDEVVHGINFLLKQQRIAAHSVPNPATGGKTSKFSLVNEETSARLKSLAPEQKNVYQLIMDSKDQGIQTKDLQRKTSLPLAHVKQICLKLKEREMVRDIKPVHSKRTAVWIGWNVTPSKDIAGGLWYQNGELQEAQIENYRTAALQVLSARPDRAWTLEEICGAVRQPNETQRMRQILRTLELDCIIDKEMSIDLGLGGNNSSSSSSSAMLDPLGGGAGPGLGAISSSSIVPSSSAITRWRIRERHSLYSFDVLRDVPCMRCQVRRQCDSATVFSNSTPNPSSCKYLTRWLYLSTPGDEEDEQDDPDAPGGALVADMEDIR